MRKTLCLQASTRHLHAGVSARACRSRFEVDFVYEAPLNSCVTMTDPIRGLLSLPDMEMVTQIYLGAYGHITQKPLKLFSSAGPKLTNIEKHSIGRQASRLRESCFTQALLVAQVTQTVDAAFGRKLEVRAKAR